MPGWHKTPAARAADAETYGPEYRRNRNAARRRAGGRCEQCDHAHPRLQCDHICNVASGPPDHSLGNLQMLCVGEGSCKCHERKTGGEGNRASRRGKDPEPQQRTRW